MTIKKEFKVGDRVAANIDYKGNVIRQLVYDEHGEKIKYGHVKEVLPNEEVKVLWEDSYLNLKVVNQMTSRFERTEPVTVSIHDLFSEEEAKEQLSILESEFKAVEKEIQEKLELAGALIKEANNLSKKVGQSSVSEMYDAIQPLYDAMDDCGWSTSSFSC